MIYYYFGKEFSKEIDFIDCFFFCFFNYKIIHQNRRQRRIQPPDGIGRPEETVSTFWTSWQPSVSI